MSRECVGGSQLQTIFDIIITLRVKTSANDSFLTSAQLSLRNPKDFSGHGYVTSTIHSMPTSTPEFSEVNPKRPIQTLNFSGIGPEKGFTSYIANACPFQAVVPDAWYIHDQA